MRRRQTFAQNNRAPVPSGAGMGAAAASVPPAPSPVSAPLTREQEEARALIWNAGKMVDAFVDAGVLAPSLAAEPVLTSATDPSSNARRKPGWPKGKKRGPRK